ncbi:phage major capsid protein [Herbiconiux ginsengi]|uniref:Phage major capsid protein, HK97 family n=1 Tax=Herbiconiux ginsengi TaxID=381665 RepID=A0A1H3PN25_9MICO|nr:phage major capsid protein [Herbiconiux ginsengi]SDZ02418.1 phage major capsid protein, HK97 family [Herbiconiux ginsengi]
MTSAIATNIKRIMDERAAAWENTAKPLAEIAQTREFTAEERQTWERAEADHAAYSERIKSLRLSLDQEREIAEFAHSQSESRDSAAHWINVDTGAPAALRSNERFSSHPVAARGSERDDLAKAQYSGVGEMVRALTTTGGSAIIPTDWAGQLIDLARAKAAVTQAGATIVPMGAPTVNIGRITGDPSAAFRAEGSAITSSDPTFDNVTLTSKSMSALVIGTREWFQDAENADQVVAAAIAQAIAGQLDMVALYGAITAGAGAINLPTPPNPRGILAALNANKPANVLGTAAANGTPQTTGAYWNEVIDLLYTVRNGNENPTGLVWNSRLDQQYAKAYDTTGQPLSIPAAVADVPRYSSNTIPSYTLGTMANRATDLFAGDFSQLIIGQRLGLTIQVLNERYADEGKIGVVAHWRGDIQPARPGAFAVYRGLQGAA